MLKSTNRLKKKADFLLAYSKGKKVRVGPLLVISRPNNLPNTRIGVVVSKKVSSKAVVRNKIRRSLSALLEPIQADSQLAGNDVVLQVVEFPDLSEKPYRYFSPFIEQWLKRLSG